MNVEIVNKDKIDMYYSKQDIPGETSLTAGAYIDDKPVEVIYSKTVFIIDDNMAIYDEAGNVIFGDNPIINIIEE